MNTPEEKIDLIYDMLDPKTEHDLKNHFLLGLSYLSSQELQEVQIPLMKTYDLVRETWQVIFKPNDEEFVKTWTKSEWILINEFEKVFYQTNLKIGRLDLDSPKIHENENFQQFMLKAKALLNKLQPTTSPSTP